MRQSQRFEKAALRSAASVRSSSSTSRGSSVLLTAVELFVGRSRHDVEEKRIFTELAKNLLSSTPVAERRRAASLLASHPEIPDDVLELMAQDEDALTAYPVLRYSPRLSVDFQLKIAASGPDTLRKAIAHRPSLHESVVTALCENAEADIVRILLDRDDILLSEKQKSTLSNRSDIVATLGLELARQDALNPEGLMAKFLDLTRPLKAKAIAAAEMTSLVKQAQSPSGVTAEGSARTYHKLRDTLVEEALRKNEARFISLLSQGLGLSPSSCDLLLQKGHAEGLAIALKALGLRAEQVATVLVRMLGDRLNLSQLKALLRLHHTLSSGAAEVLVGQWILQDQNDRTSPQAHQPQYQERKPRKDEAVQRSEDRAVVTRQNIKNIKS